MIVVGAGKVGYYLAKFLLAQGHAVAVAEKAAPRWRNLGPELGDVLVRGDNSTSEGLAHELARREPRWSPPAPGRTRQTP